VDLAVSIPYKLYIDGFASRETSSGLRVLFPPDLLLSSNLSCKARFGLASLPRNRCLFLQALLAWEMLNRSPFEPVCISVAIAKGEDAFGLIPRGGDR